MDFMRQSPPVLPLFASAAQRGRQQELTSVANQSQGSSSSTTWVANLISYMPVAFPWDYPANRVFWLNGNTVASTNVQFGIYTWDGTRIYTTGTVAQGTALVPQYVTPSPAFVLSAGRYYFAWTCDNTTGRGSAHGGSALSGAMWGMLEETPGAFGLPATMAGAVRWARAFGYSCCGLTRTASGF